MNGENDFVAGVDVDRVLMIGFRVWLVQPSFTSSFFFFFHLELQDAHRLLLF